MNCCLIADVRPTSATSSPPHSCCRRIVVIGAVNVTYYTTHPFRLTTTGVPDPSNLPPEDPKPQPRAIFHMSNADAEIWCVSDLLEHLPDQAKFQSSSEVKAKYLPRIFEFAGMPALVIAFGTAGYPELTTQNGSVVVGARVFMHNCHPNGQNPDSNWSEGPFDTVLESPIDDRLFNALTVVETSPTPTVLGRFVVEPLNPSPQSMLFARHDYTAVGSLNVTDYTEYEKTDAASLAAFVKSNNVSLARSLETTHGLICSMAKAPFVFVSGITDRVGHFSEEVAPRTYAQNVVAAHNAGIIIAWMLARSNVILA